jgi:hypothetical protein
MIPEINFIKFIKTSQRTKVLFIHKTRLSNFKPLRGRIEPNSRIKKDVTPVVPYIYLSFNNKIYETQAHK